jgi:hypothetical protein
MIKMMLGFSGIGGSLLLFLDLNQEHGVSFLKDFRLAMVWF